MQDYLTPGHPTYLSGMTKLKRALGSGVSLAAVRRFLDNVDAYTLHREAKRPRAYNPIYVRGRDELWQADLADVSRLQGDNDGVRYLLTVIDTFSRRAWAEPLKTKDAEGVWRAFRRELGKTRRPRRLLTDRGREFTGAPFRRGLERLGIHPVHLHSEQKAAHVERFNRTLKRLVYGYVAQSGDGSFVKRLPDLLRTYNRRHHRIIGMAPMEADRPNNRRRVLATLGKRHYWRPRKQARFAPDDLVRVQRWKGAFHRGHDESFSRHVYRVESVNTRKPLPTYRVATLEGEPVEGSFYGEELQRVRFHDVFRVNKILRRKGNRVLVSWKGWGPDYNAWIDTEDLREQRRREEEEEEEEEEEK